MVLPVPGPHVERAGFGLPSNREPEKQARKPSHSAKGKNQIETGKNHKATVSCGCMAIQLIAPLEETTIPPPNSCRKSQASSHPLRYSRSQGMGGGPSDHRGHKKNPEMAGDK